MRIVFSTASLDRAPDQATALARLVAADLAPVELGELPGEVETPEASVVSAYLAFLPVGGGRVNLAAADDDLRRQGVRAVTEALARCQWLGIPRYQVEAGWNLDQTLSRNGHPPPPPLPPHRRAHALAQLERSLDRLAEEADARGLGIGVVNMPRAAGGLLTDPVEMRQVLRTVGAPDLKISLALGPLAEAARHSRGRPGRFDPDEAAAGLRDVLCDLRLPSWAAKPEAWVSEVCGALAPLPLVLGAGARDPSHLRSLAAALAEDLHATA